jgi:hypothetical protein
LPANATLLADLADVSAMAQGKRLAGEPARLIQQALDADPRHVKALGATARRFEARDPPPRAAGSACSRWCRRTRHRPLRAGRHAGDEAEAALSAARLLPGRP